MRMKKGDNDRRRRKALEYLNEGIYSKDFCGKMTMVNNDMTKYFARIRARGVVINKKKSESGEYFYTLGTPLDVAFYLMDFGETKMSKQTLSTKEPSKKESDRTKFRHSETPWYILTR